MPEEVREEVTARHAALEFDVTVQHVYALIYAGRIKGRKVDGKWLLNADEVRTRAGALLAKRAKSADAAKARRAQDVLSMSHAPVVGVERSNTT
jgi:hypothetical protein